MFQFLSGLRVSGFGALRLGMNGSALLANHAANCVEQVQLSWQLCAGHAQTLCPRRSGRLYVQQGRAWLTAGAYPWASVQQDEDKVADVAADDRVLCAGQTLTLRAGRAVVIEAWPRHGEALSLVWRQD